MKEEPFPVFHTKIVINCLQESIFMLRPRVQLRNPTMFVTYLGAIITSIYVISEIINHSLIWFNFLIALWLWVIVIVANFAEAIAESRGKAQAESLRKTQTEAYAKQIQHGIEVKIPSSELKKGDLIICESGDIIPGSGGIRKLR